MSTQSAGASVTTESEPTGGAREAEHGPVEICSLSDLEPDWGEVALIGEHQVAVFRMPDDTVYACDHADPNSGALVMARGIVGETVDGVPTVASPLYKEVYDLRTGACRSGAAFTLPVHTVTVDNGRVLVELGS
ncbi:nitrite reductase small subunit NirD [Kocuria sp.]|uniref:nitrite reductase small subunit NirD n=1 Tax=Kocuria sp. TaxID=1871328 RepID=UPI0026DFCA3B|nr:nitrite reductase small subunit NirD [Kocuria sp.]MDO5619093.1 nitrite reductase small subunit NirD [Kocuria sp.]